MSFKKFFYYLLGIVEDMVGRVIGIEVWVVLSLGVVGEFGVSGWDLREVFVVSRVVRRGGGGGNEVVGRRVILRGL